MKRSVMGLDLSLTSTGVSCDGRTWTIAAKSKGAQRLYDIRARLRVDVAANHHPGVVIEGYSFASRNSQAHSIGELGGVVRLLLHDLGIPYVEVPPTVRAKFATGRGNAGKNEVVSAVSARTGIVWDGAGGDDRCDAYILEEMGRAVLGRQRHDWPAANLAALEKIDWSELEEYCG
jgi:crossover junction endodeoxyribonuclease RuvC